VKTAWKSRSHAAIFLAQTWGRNGASAEFALGSILATRKATLADGLVRFGLVGYADCLRRRQAAIKASSGVDVAPQRDC